jgi:SAM-dependent methyltransferase
VNHGIIRAVRPEWLETIGDQQDAWRRLEKARGRLELPWESVLQLPDVPRVRSSLEWLRKMLQSRGVCRVLELGAGRGWATRRLAEDGHQAVASDISDDAQIGLGCAMRQCTHTSGQFGCVQAPAEALPFRPQSFDCVFCCATLRHVPDLERVFREVSRVLRPGGFFVALDEPFRGILTSQVQWFQDSALYRLARGWIIGNLPDDASPELQWMRVSVGTTLYDQCRRVPFCIAAAAAAGLQMTVLPAPVLSSLSPDLQRIKGAEEGVVSEWLDALSAAYDMDAAGMRSAVEFAHHSLGFDLGPPLLGYWTLVGNGDGVMLGKKGNDGVASAPAQQSIEPERMRQLDLLFLAYASQGIVPIYGFYPMEGSAEDRYCWIEPEAAFLMPAAESIELTATCPPSHIRSEPALLEFRLEEERTPLAVLMMRPGKTIHVKVPLPPAPAHRPALLVRLRTNLGFLPSDFDPRVQDTRLLGLQLRSIRARRISPDAVPNLLKNLHTKL